MRAPKGHVTVQSVGQGDAFFAKNYINCILIYHLIFYTLIYSI